MHNTYSAGVVTAYGAAKKAGYTGTYEEFCAEQAQFAQNAQQVREDKEAVEQTVETFEEATVPAAVQAVTDEGTTQVGRVNQAGSSQVESIGEAGTTQVGNVNQAGSTQVAAVNQAGATQIQAVEDKGDEVIESIPADYTQLSEDVDELKNAVNNNESGTLDYMLTDTIDLLKLIPWNKGSYIDNANGNLVTNSRAYYSDYIPVSDLADEFRLVLTSTNFFKYAQYNSSKEYISGLSVGSALDKSYTFSANTAYIRLSVGAWSGSQTISDYCKTISFFVKPKNDVIKHDFIGYSELSFTKDSYISTPAVSTQNVSTTPASLTGCSCFSVACTKGQIFNITGTPRDNSGTRAVMFLNSANTCIYRNDQTTAFNGDEIVAPENGTLVVNMLMSPKPLAYTGFKDLSAKIFANMQDINTIKTATPDAVPEYITNAMSVRQLGTLENAYICLTCDDGAAELESYTIPMLLTKNVPCTFGLWASTSKVGAAQAFNKSVILQSASGISALNSAIEAGCSVAQHGPLEWTEMTAAELNEFFDREATAWEHLGITVKGAICPSHCINNKVRVVAGGRFGVVRSGYHGYLSKSDQQAAVNGDVFAAYSYYCTGPRSNVFGLSSFNTNAVTLSLMKAAVDFAIAQKMILVVYWHDWDLTAEQKSDLEAFIDYAKAQNITFCTLGEIPHLA